MFEGFTVHTKYLQTIKERRDFQIMSVKRAQKTTSQINNKFGHKNYILYYILKRNIYFSWVCGSEFIEIVKMYTFLYFFQERTKSAEVFQERKMSAEVLCER